mmetsp:Transcript_29439/g.54638  ORF Transcript_29439/g.54638 Transcript_29439/m.54638 type:complete len:112 (-) Transcript_29439:701-1036(-)
MESISHLRPLALPAKSSNETTTSIYLALSSAMRLYLYCALQRLLLCHGIYFALLSAEDSSQVERPQKAPEPKGSWRRSQGCLLLPLRHEYLAMSKYECKSIYLALSSAVDS